MTLPNHAPATFRTGSPIDAVCTKCDMPLTHTIIAMVGPKVVRVRCNTCGADHAFRGEQPLAKPARTTAPKKPTISWESRIAACNVTTAKKYSPRDSFRVDDVIDHPTFGLGVVTAIRSDKIDVAFRAYEKTLVTGRPQA